MPKGYGVFWRPGEAAAPLRLCAVGGDLVWDGTAEPEGPVVLEAADVGEALGRKRALAHGRPDWPPYSQVYVEALR